MHLFTLLATMILISATEITANEEGTMSQYTIAQKEPLIIMGIECRTSNAPDAGPHDIPKLWSQFFNEGIVERIPNKISNEVIALYCDYEGDYTKPYSLIIGCPVSSTDEIPPGMTAKTLPATSYAVFRSVGEYPKSLIDTWGSIWSTKLDRTYTGDFEVHGDFMTGLPQTVDVYIAIEE